MKIIFIMNDMQSMSVFSDFRQVPADLSADKEMSMELLTAWKRFIFVVSPNSAGAVSGMNLKWEAFLLLVVVNGEHSLNKLWFFVELISRFLTSISYRLKKKKLGFKKSCVEMNVVPLIIIIELIIQQVN